MKYLGEHGDGKSVGTFAQGISGAVAGQYVKIQSVDENGVPTRYAGDAPPGGDVTADMLGIVINGNSTPVGASVGQYVIVKNSTISGITDGLYTAAQTIPANTAIDSTYLRAVSNGGLNSIATNVYSLSAAANVTLSTYTCVIVASKMCVFQFEITANAEINAYTSVVTGFPAPQELADIIGLNNNYTFSQFYVDNLGKPNAGHLRTRTRIPSGTVVRFTATYAL